MGQNLTYRPLPGSRLNMSHPMARNMALCMLFNEQGSRAMDLSPYQANGRLHGFGSPAKRHIVGLDFVAATPSYVEIPASFSQLDFTSEDFSIIMRVKFDNLTSINWLFNRGLGNTDGYYMLARDTGTIEFQTNQSTTSQKSVSSVGDITVGPRFTIGISKSGASVRLHKSGVDVTSTAAEHINPVTCNRTALVGIYYDKIGYPFDGKMEFLYIWRRTLSELEHRAVHESPYSPMGYNLFI